jgi:type I restriction enzyme M protein
MNNQNSQQNSLDKKELKASEKIFRDALSGETIKWTPEEEVRQLFIKKLIKEYKYPKGHIKKEVTIKSGQTETKKKADIVVFHNDKNFRSEENAYIII